MHDYFDTTYVIYEFRYIEINCVTAMRWGDTDKKLRYLYLTFRLIIKYVMTSKQLMIIIILYARAYKNHIRNAIRA